MSGVARCRAIRTRYSTKVQLRMAESKADSRLSRSKTQHRHTITSSIGISVNVVVRPTVIGAMSTVTPRTRPTLAMFEPKALPIASAPEPVAEDIIETRISGAEVPTDTMVMPISSGDNPTREARAAAPSINRSALQTRTASPMTMVRRLISMGSQFSLFGVFHLDR